MTNCKYTVSTRKTQFGLEPIIKSVPTTTLTCCLKTTPIITSYVSLLVVMMVTSNEEPFLLNINPHIIYSSSLIY